MSHDVPYVIHANLDCEARWAGSELPGKIASRVSLYAALLAVHAEWQPVEIWAPAAVDPSRLLAAPHWTPPVMRVGAPPAPHLQWADPAARAANDRRLALEVAAAAGLSLPGAHVIHAVEDLDGVLGPWVCKSPWTSAGRDRCHGEGPPTAEQRTRLTRLLEAAGALVFEPWKDRILDVGRCARVRPTGQVSAQPPHGLVTDARGTFLGIDLSPPDLLAAEVDELDRAIVAAGAALHRLGYAGPFAIDAFAYREGPSRRFQPLCEINARLSFGAVTRAFHKSLRVTRLGFGAPPSGATVLIAPGDDGVTAWCA